MSRISREKMRLSQDIHAPKLYASLLKGRMSRKMNGTTMRILLAPMNGRKDCFPIDDRLIESTTTS